MLPYQTYNKLFRILHKMDRFDLQLKSEFVGSPVAPSAVEWLQNAEHVCKLCKIKEPPTVITLRLTGGVYAIASQR